jgi:hypothetical protein
MENYETAMLNAVWFLSKYNNKIEEYHEAKRVLSYHFSAMHQVVSEMNRKDCEIVDNGKQGTALKFIYEIYSAEIFKSLSVCMRAIWDNDRAEFMRFLDSTGYFVNAMLERDGNTVKFSPELLLTCKKWVDNMDYAFPKEYMAQFHISPPDIIDKFSYSRINVCAILKIFIFYIFISSFE